MASGKKCDLAAQTYDRLGGARIEAARNALNRDQWLGFSSWPAASPFFKLSGATNEEKLREQFGA